MSITSLIPAGIKGQMKEGFGKLREQIDKRPLVWSITMVALSILCVGLMIAFPTFLPFLIGPALLLGVGGIAIGCTYLMNKNKRFAQILTKVNAVVLPILYIGGVAAFLALAPHSFVFLAIGVVAACGIVPIIMFSISQLRRRETSVENSRMTKNRMQRQQRRQNSSRETSRTNSAEQPSSAQKTRRRATQAAKNVHGRNLRPAPTRSPRPLSPAERSLSSDSRSSG